MAIVGLGSVRARTVAIADDIVGNRARRAITAGAMVGQAYAAMLTPIDTSNLINSQFRRISNTAKGWRATIGYTAAYAAAVHEMKGTLKGQPRRHFGKTKEGVAFGGGTGNGRYWDPDAEPQFLRKGVENHRDDVDRAVRRELSL